jgi:hypothetical protein
MCVYRRGLDGWMDLLTTYTHDSELQAITAPPLISPIHKSPQYLLSLLPACCVLTSRSLATASNSGDSSVSRSQVLSSQLPVQNWSQCQSYVTTDGHSASLSWNKAPIWGLRPDFHYCQTINGFVDMGRPLWREEGSVFYNVEYTIYLHFTCYCLNVYTIYTRLLSVEAQYSRSCPIFISFRLWILVIILLHEIELNWSNFVPCL